MGGRLTVRCEGTVLHAYQDIGGVWTIGNGSITLMDGSPVTSATPDITLDQAHALMMRELMPDMDKIDALLRQPGLYQFAKVYELAACYSFAYNIGLNGFAGSTFLRAWKTEGPVQAAPALLMWVYDDGKVSQGLTNRRNLERQVFLGQVTI